MTRLVLYVAAPLAPTPEQIAERATHYHPVASAIRSNVRRAMRWLSWLQRSFPETTFVAPWIASVLAGSDEHDPAQREAGLIDDCAVVAICDGVVLVGGRISSGMARERRHARRCWDLTDTHWFSEDPPSADDGHPVVPWMLWAENCEVAP